MSFDVVIPTAGRPALGRLLRALGDLDGPHPGRVIVVDDRRRARDPLPIPRDERVDVVRGPAAGPAAARNTGWRSSWADWIAFLDDDVLPTGGWLCALREDLTGLAPWVAGSQGRIRVPMPAGRRPTDWERNVRGLEEAAWATADMAYRREALARVGGFDERFPRAYREDADLALRTTRAGWRLARGRRSVVHPARPADWAVSVRVQAGNADDALMRALHGRHWRRDAQAPRGRLRAHLAVTVAGAWTVVALAARRPRGALAPAAAWAAGTAELAWRRIAPGPRTAREGARMLVTSALIPPAAVAHRARGLAPRRASRGPVAAASPGPPLAAPPGLPEAVLLDRDGTIVVDVPYNGDPARVRPVPGATRALARLRAAGVRLAVISNQSGIARGLLTAGEVDAVNRRVDELLGPVGPFLVCPHGPREGCTCRKPGPGLVQAAAERLGTTPERCVVIGDIGADVAAARAAGARAVLVPTPDTRRDEVAAAPLVAADLGAAVELLLGAPEPERVVV